MVKSDRAFRALARSSPESVIGLVRAARPQFLAPEVVVRDLLATQLDIPAAPNDSDWAVTMSSDEVLHVEAQGYRETGFPERIFWYHVTHAARARPRRVRTVAVWLIRPPATQRIQTIEVGDLTLRVTSIVLSEVPVESLLANPATCCFAPGADLGTRKFGEVAKEVAQRLAQAGGGYAAHMAVVAAATRGRYGEMVNALEQAGVEPVIIEDLIKIGEERGEAKGQAQGRAQELSAAILHVLARRKVELTEPQLVRVRSTTDLETLRTWLDRAIDVATADEVFADA